MSQSQQSSALWNAVETLLVAWARDLEESLETNTEPDWLMLSEDLQGVLPMIYTLGTRQAKAASVNGDPDVPATRARVPRPA